MGSWDYESATPALNDTRVDRLADVPSGPIDQFPVLTLNLPDREIIGNLNLRIEDSLAYWDDTKGFDLRSSRNENVRLHLGKQVDVSRLYRYQVPYVENEIFVGTETIVSYLTTRQPQAEVYPAQDEDRSKQLAIDLERVLNCHSERFDLKRKLEVCVRNLLLKRVAFLKLRFDSHHGKKGEIVVEVIDPEHVIVDKNAAMGENPAFICHVLKMSVEEMCIRFPKKKNEIYEALGIVRGTPKQMTQEVAVREVWFTHYDKGEPQECVAWYFGKCVLDKGKNPNWRYSGDNFLDMPLKPFIPLNYINDGSHWIDSTTPVEQAASMQNILNKRGRQIMENADKANGILVISTDSGLTKDDAQNLTGDPNQKLLIKTSGNPVGSLVYQIPPHNLPSYVMDDKLDARNIIHTIMGTPAEFRGDDESEDGDGTLGQAMMVKNQAAGRQDLIGRAIDAFMGRYFNFLTQMMVVWYDEDHYFVYNGGDGEFDHIIMRRDLIEDGIAVDVKSGATLPFDKSRQEAVALQLAKLDMISPLDLYKDLHMDNAQKRYDNWFKWKSDPSSLSRSGNDELDDSEAYVDYITIMNGGNAKPRDDASREHILTHRKQMLKDTFLKGKRSLQNKFIDHLEKELISLEMRMSLDAMSEAGPQELDVSVPVTPPPPPMPMMPGMQPGGQPPMGGGGMPGQMPTGPGAPMPLPSQTQMAPQADLGAIMRGTGLMNPGAPQTPALSNPSGVASL